MGRDELVVLAGFAISWLRRRPRPVPFLGSVCRVNPKADGGQPKYLERNTKKRADHTTLGLCHCRSMTATFARAFQQTGKLCRKTAVSRHLLRRQIDWTTKWRAGEKGIGRERKGKRKRCVQQPDWKAGSTGALEQSNDWSNPTGGPLDAGCLRKCQVRTPRIRGQSHCHDLEMEEFSGFRKPICASAIWD